jgi:succinate dehydrogenase flavin-adding protein (antitoxin of CptAB toxin-antitoxin module)
MRIKQESIIKYQDMLPTMWFESGKGMREMDMVLVGMTTLVKTTYSPNSLRRTKVILGVSNCCSERCHSKLQHNKCITLNQTQ